MGRKKKCPEYDLSQCATPHLPPSCPMKHNFFKRPCYRYRCSAEEETDVLELLTTLDPSVTTRASVPTPESSTTSSISTSFATTIMPLLSMTPTLKQKPIETETCWSASIEFTTISSNPIPSANTSEIPNYLVPLLGGVVALLFVVLISILAYCLIKKFTNYHEDNERQRIRAENLQMEERRQQWDRIGRNRSQTTNIANGTSATAPTTSTSTTSTTTATIPTTTPTPTTTSTPTPVIPDLPRRLEKPFDKPGHGIRMQDLQRDVKHYESGASSSNSKESCGGSLTSSPRSGISAARTSSGSDFQDDLEQLIRRDCSSQLEFHLAAKSLKIETSPFTYRRSPRTNKGIPPNRFGNGVPYCHLEF